MKPLSSNQINYIISLLQAGHSVHDIAQAAHRSMGAISKISQKYLSDLSKSSEGCSPMLNDHDMCYVTHLLTSGEVDTAPQLAKRLEALKDTTISAQTIRNYLGAAGLKAITKKKRPYLKPGHHRARMNFAKKHLYWTVEDWKRIILLRWIKEMSQ